MILNARSLLAILSLMMTLLFPRRNLSMKFRLILSSQRLLLAQLTREYPSLLAHLTLKYSFHCQLIHLMISWWPVGGSPFFTTLPSGRVGSAHDSVYSSNDEFKQGCAFMGVHYIIMQWQNSVLLLGGSTVLKLQVKKLRMHVELKISMMELTTLVHPVYSEPASCNFSFSLHLHL
ncbi:PREDICTED: uncharacterized protein LOC105134029 isoform X3 [Populus euphratica]|uniref:Uncharacterized protein LOC105134029 isoform X3 n=1 Tax=Populus euphratica TaxID=75702 RepID=A0AAJ6UUT0_POPEU|nr:PREDICTED: uncharacterized protein LOC105134029 isoform X3 [Populus euphratica]